MAIYSHEMACISCITAASPHGFNGCSMGACRGWCVHWYVMCYCEKDYSVREGCTIVLLDLHRGAFCVIGEAAMDCFDDKRRANQVVVAAKAIKWLLHGQKDVAEAWRVGVACKTGAWLGLQGDGT